MKKKTPATKKKAPAMKKATTAKPIWNTSAELKSERPTPVQVKPQRRRGRPPGKPNRHPADTADRTSKPARLKRKYTKRAAKWHKGGTAPSAAPAIIECIERASCAIVHTVKVQPAQLTLMKMGIDDNLSAQYFTRVRK